MSIESITPTRDIGNDFLFRIDSERIIRARVTRTTPDSAIQGAVEQRVELVHFKFQCSLASSDSGDVVEDGAGHHVIFAAEVHGVSLEALAAGQSLEGWIAERLEEIVAKADRKGFFLGQIANRYRI